MGVHNIKRKAGRMARTDGLNPFGHSTWPIQRKSTNETLPVTRAKTTTTSSDLAEMPREDNKDMENSEAINSETTVAPGESNADDLESGHGHKKKKKRPSFSFWSQIRGTILNSWINILLIFVPIGMALHYSKGDPKIIFTFNFLAIIPLAGLLSYATEEIALRVGETLGGLLNASFGNAVELIVSILALRQRQVLIVQTSLIGSILSNLLLVMGMCFFFGGLNRVEQHFNVTVAQTAASLLALAVGSLIIPTAFHDFAKVDRGVKELSRGTAIILLLVYACYLFFQLKTHADVFNEKSQKVEDRKDLRATANRKIPGFMNWREKRKAKKQIKAETKHPELKDTRLEKEAAQDRGEDEEDAPQLAMVTALATLLISTVFIAFCAEFMVDAIDAVSTESGLSKEFVGLILLPIVGNAAEHATAVTVAIKDKMDLAIGVAVGSSMQIALLVIPFVVVLGWIMKIDNMTLYFDGFQIAVLFVSVLLINYLIQDGKSHWLEGVLLMAAYAIIGTAAFFYPNGESSDGSGGGAR